MRNNKKKIIISILLTLFLLVSTTMAWFFANNDVEVDYGSTIQCQAGDSLEISVDGGVTWHSTVKFPANSPKIIDISGNGIDLYRPKVITETGEPQSFVKALPIDENEEGDYIEMQVMLRSATKMNVYFSGESYILPNSTSTEQTNIYGKFSKDNIAGAARVAVIENVDGVEQLKMLWAPNPRFELSNRDGVYSFTSNGTPETSYSYYYANGGDLADMRIYRITTKEYVDKQFVVGSTGCDITTTGNSPILTVLDSKLNPEDIVYTKALTIRIWFEGTDREASQALSGGWASMLFKFNGMQKSDAEPEKQAAINALSYSNGEVIGLQNGMVYSSDGRVWVEYSADAPAEFAPGATYYFKFPETETNYETAYKTVKIG